MKIKVPSPLHILPPCGCPASRLLFFLFPLLLSCSDALLDDGAQPSQPGDDGPSLLFTPLVSEQADLLVQLGQTRAANGIPRFDSLTVAALTPASRPLQGSTPTGSPAFFLHRQALPLVGIHNGTVGSTRGLSLQQEDTRASASAIIPSGSDPINFHDSLTIWGSVYNTDDPSNKRFRQLFRQTLLKKVRGFRSSVHWPYTNSSHGTDMKGGEVEDAQEWPGRYMNFCALAPAYESLEDLTIIEPSGTDVWDATDHLKLPQFTYSVPEDPRAQRDLLFGISPDIDVQAGPSESNETYPQADTERERHLGADDKVVSLNFYHILTAVRFAQGKMPTGVTITKVGLDDIIFSGTFTPDPANLPGSWGDLGNDKKDYSIQHEWRPTYYDVAGYAGNTVNGKTYASGENVYIDGDSVLFLMPHILSAAAMLHVDLKDAADNEHHLTCNLAGDVWRPGYTVTYVITIGEVASDYYLYVEGQNESTSHAAGSTDATDATETTTTASGTFTIHSYRSFLDYAASADGTPKKNYAANWQVTGFSQTGEDDSYHDEDYTDASNNTIYARPRWLISITGWDTGTEKPAHTNLSENISTLSYTFSSQSSVYGPGALNHADILKGNSSASSLDLSRGGSANSYIVNAPGTYIFDAVYGNSQGQGQVLSSNTTFVDHNGWPIKSPEIYKATPPTQPSGSAGNLCLTSQEIEENNTTPGTYTSTYFREEYIYNKNNDDITVETLWKDTPNNVIPSTNWNSGGSVGFTVDQSAMTPCNYIIGVYGKPTLREYVQIDKSGGGDGYPAYRTYDNPTATERELLWTYHIWITDEVYANTKLATYDDGITKLGTDPSCDPAYPSYNTVQDANGSKIARLTQANGTTKVADVLPVPLGWVPTDNTWSVYKPRAVWVEVSQVDANNNPTGNKIHLKLRQEAKPDLYTGTSMLYQWGRPNPLPMSTATISGATITTASINTLAGAIRNPTKVATGWMPGATPYWSTTEKTLYDPCPPGYQLPASTAPFSGFSLTGGNVAVGADPNSLNLWPGWGSASKGGYMFTTKHTALDTSTEGWRYNQPVIYIPTGGYWTDAYERQRAASTFFWTATPGQSLQLAPDKGTPGFVTFGATSPGSSALMPILPVKSE